MTSPRALSTEAEPLSYSPYDYKIHEDPYPTYARLRSEAPLFHNEQLDFWALSRHDDVLGAFRNPAQLSNRFGVSLDPAAYGPQAHRAMSFLAMDPPVHTRMRSLVSKAFTPRRVAELETRVRAIALEHIERALEQQAFDFVSDFAGRMPMDVISEMTGVPSADRSEVRRLADLLVHRDEGFFDIPPEGVEAALVLAGYFQELVSARRASRTGDLTSALV
ncbi:MAG: cytochrome P450, partial [Acidimicrobiales bacterium]